MRRHSISHACSSRSSRIFGICKRCIRRVSTASVSASGTYSAPASEEGWGEDLYRFLDGWHDITNPIPFEAVPPRWWLRRRIDRVEAEIDAVARVNPDLAESMRAVTAEVARAVIG